LREKTRAVGPKQRKFTSWQERTKSPTKGLKLFGSGKRGHSRDPTRTTRTPRPGETGEQSGEEKKAYDVVPYFGREKRPDEKEVHCQGRTVRVDDPLGMKTSGNSGRNWQLWRVGEVAVSLFYAP